MSGLRGDFHVCNVESIAMFETVGVFRCVKEKSIIIDVISHSEFPLVSLQPTVGCRYDR